MSTSADQNAAERPAGSRSAAFPEHSSADRIAHLLTSFVEQSDDAILVCAAALADPGGKDCLDIVYANSAAKRLLGRAGSALIGRDLRSVLAAACNEPAEGMLRDVIQSRSSISIGLSLRRADEFAGAYSMHAIPLVSDRQLQPRYLAFVLRERPMLKQRDNRESTRETLQRLQHLAAIGTVAAGLSHDMGNLLLPIRGHLKALKNAGLGDDARMHLDGISESADYLEQTTENLRLFALDPESTADIAGVTHLKEWLGHVLLLLKYAIPDDVHFVPDFPDDLPSVGIAAHRLTQAVLNLLLNAKEAVAGSGTIRLWAELEADGQFIRIGVTDDGCGMTSEVREKCVIPFFTTKTRGRSTGLGLALVHGVAVAAGGSVEFDSRPGHGATVIMRLPVARSGADAVDVPVEKAGLVACVSLSDRRVRACFTTLLQSVGFAVREGPPPDHGRVDVWVTDANRKALDTAKDVHANNSRCRIIVFGTCPDDWRSVCTTSIDKEGGLVAIRRVLDHVIGVGPVEKLHG